MPAHEAYTAHYAFSVANIHHVIVHTGQHYESPISEGIFADLEISSPNFNLTAGSGSHGWQVGRMFPDVVPVLPDEIPYIVLVYEDTNSKIAAALSVLRLHMPVSLLEAGLRPFRHSDAGGGS